MTDGAQPMRFDILTAFPKMFEGPFEEGVVGRAARRRLLEINVHDLRRYATGVQRQVDDAAYGGGPGMVLKPEPIFAAVAAASSAGNCPSADGNNAGSSTSATILTPSYFSSFARNSPA